MKITIIHDDNKIANLLRNDLLTYNSVHSVDIYNHPLDVLVRLDSLHPDVIFLDVLVNDYDTFELIPWFYDKLPNLNLVFISNNSDLAVEAFNISAVDYLLEDYTKSRLDQTLTHLEYIHALSPNDYYSIKSFGSFELFDDNMKSIRWRTRKSKELFVYLWLNRKKSVNRDILIENIFPGDYLKDSSALLSTTLYQLRQVLKSLPIKCSIDYLNNGYQLNMKVRSDYDLMISILYSDNFSIESYRSLRSVYRGAFLQDEAYEWASKYTKEIDKGIKVFLLKVKENNENDEEKKIFLKDILMFLYELDPLDESIAIEIMNLHRDAQSPLKLRIFFEKYKVNLKVLASTEPSDLVKNTYLKIIKGIRGNI